MNRLLIRFLLVLIVGGAVLWLVTRGEKAREVKESPTVQSGPLGELGGRTERGPRGVHVNPIRDIRVTMMEEIENPSGRGTLFQPIAEVRGAKAEFITPVRQRIADAVAVYELSDEKLGADARQEVFGTVIRYRPPAAGVKPAPGAAAEDPTRARPRITHLRIQAAEAILLNDGADRAVDFHGAPPDGVKISLFAAGGQPLLEIRTATLRCTARTQPGEPMHVLITSRKQIRVFTPDGRSALEGTGLHGVMIDPGSDRGRGTLRLGRDIRFEARGGLARRDRDKPARTRDRTTVITCAGPAVLRARTAKVRDPDQPDAKPKRRVMLDTLSLENEIHATERYANLDKNGAIRDHVAIDLHSDLLSARIADGRGLVWADAVGNVRVRSVRRTPGAPGAGDAARSPSESTVEVRGQRARLENPEKGPRGVRIFAWSFPPTVRLPLLPRHVQPVVEATFRDADTEDAHLLARCDGDIELQSLHPDLAHRQFRVAVNKNVVLDVQGIRRGDAKKGGDTAATDESAKTPAGKKNKDDKPSWLPGSSVIRVRDRFVLDYLGLPDRWLEFSAKGDVRIETLLGKFRAEEIRGELPSRDRWTIEATGYPRLEHPIVSRSAPHLARALDALSLTPAVTGARPSESSGVLIIEGRRATLDVRRDRVDGKSQIGGSVRFRDAVQVTQSETSAEAARLVCRELVFDFARGGSGETGISGGTLRARDDVVFEAGQSIRVEGDLLTFEPSAGGKKARVVLRGLPAALAVTTRDGNSATLDGRILELDAGAETARARGGVIARFQPAHGDFLLPGGAPSTKTSIGEVEIEAEEATVRWKKADRTEIVAAEADQAVRIRAFAGSRTAERGPLLQWAEADRLRYERVPAEEAGAAARRRITLFGEVDYPVRVGYFSPKKAPKKKGTDQREPDEKGTSPDFLVEVPLVVIEGSEERAIFDSVTGFGAGRLGFGSQDDAYGSSGRSGAERNRRVSAQYPRGFRLVRLEEDRFRFYFPGGGRVESRDENGKPGAMVRCNKELGLLVNSAARDKSDDFRVIEHGYAEGDVFFRYGDDTKGGCDRAFWERGTNILTIEGAPAWIQRAGDARPHTFKRAFYNRATRRFRISKGSGSLSRRFESVAKKKKTGKDETDEPELDVKEDIFPELPIDTR